MTPIKIALADDEALFRQGLKLLIDSIPDIEVVLEAGDGQELLDLLAECTELPDILLLDLQMPVLDGVKTTQQLHKKFPSIDVIVLSTHFTRSFITNMIDMGACSYVAKDTDPKDLAYTIREVYRNGFYYSKPVIEFLNKKSLAKNTKSGFSISLTAREIDVLELICNQMTTAEIAEALYISPRTVEGHRKNMLSKLNCKNTAGLVVYALENNLVQLKLE